MAALDWSQCSAVESIPGKVSGAWVFKSTRLPVATVIENLEDLSIDEVIEQFDVTREQVMAVIAFVAESLRADPVARCSSFDHGTPKGLARVLSGHTVHTAQAKGCDTLSNGDLLKAAEEARFELLLTTDRRDDLLVDPGQGQAFNAMRAKGDPPCAVHAHSGDPSISS